MAVDSGSVVVVPYRTRTTTFGTMTIILAGSQDMAGKEHQREERKQL